MKYPWWTVRIFLGVITIWSPVWILVWTFKIFSWDYYNLQKNQDFLGIIMIWYWVLIIVPADGSLVNRVKIFLDVITFGQRDICGWQSKVFSFWYEWSCLLTHFPIPSTPPPFLSHNPPPGGTFLKLTSRCSYCVFTYIYSLRERHLWLSQYFN